MQYTSEEEDNLLASLVKLFPHSSKATLRKMLTSGRVTVDGKVCYRAKHEIVVGNNIEILDKAKAIEDTVHVKGFDWNTGERKVVKKGYTWSEVGTLDVVVNLAEKREAEGKKHKPKETKRWQDIVKEQDEDDPEDKACIICSL